MTEQVVKCGVCGKHYKIYMHTVADQSACRDCVSAAEEACARDSTYVEISKRANYYKRIQSANR